MSQEHRLSLPEIAAFIADAGLAFLGFDADTALLAKYAARFPEDGAKTDLGCWHAVRDRESRDLRRDVPVLGPEAVRRPATFLSLAGSRIFVYNRLEGGVARRHCGNRYLPDQEFENADAVFQTFPRGGGLA